MNYYRRFFLRS